MKIPFVDLNAQYLEIRPEIETVMQEVMTDTVYIGGPKVLEFEKGFAEYMRADYCLGCGNGTDAIEIALQALGIGEGDEVIVPAMSWISTAEAVSTVGAIPIFADILENKHTLDPADVEKKLTSNTKAILPVHFYGRAAELDQLMAIARKHDLRVVEDCAQAHGAEFKNQRVGTFGDLGTFSFYPSKNLGAYGDAGGIVTKDEKLATTCRVIANHGQETRDAHLREGRNSRMDTLQAAILTVKLKYLDKWTDARLAKAQYYNDCLSDLPIELPLIELQHRNSFHL